MNLQQLEEKLARSSQSPLFARLAAEYVRFQRVDEALQVCRKGLKYFPEYVTAHLVAAQCLAKLNEFGPAVQHIERAIRKLPDNTTLHALREEWLKNSRARIAKDTGDTSLDELARKLESAQRISSNSGNPEEASSEEPILDDAPIVSVTLAEIYTMQGAYGAALAMYRKLQQLKPQQADQFETKIRELEDRLRRNQ